MTFPKASVKLEKTAFLRGLRWKITIAFVFLFFILLTVLGLTGSIVEYLYLKESFEQSAVSESDFILNRGVFQIENGLAIDYKNLQKDSNELLPWLDSETKNTDAIRIWLKRYNEKLKLRRKTEFSLSYLFPDESETSSNEAAQTNSPLFQFIVFDSQTDVLASSDAGDSASLNYSAQKKFVEEMLAVGLIQKREIDSQNGRSLKIAFSIFDKENRLKGVLFFRETFPLSWSGVLRNSFYGLSDQLFSNLIFIAILGFVFGSPFAWYLSKRLQKIAFAAQSWRTGDFSAKTNDKSSDEIGILSRRLNEMAEDLQENFALRQTIATAEERNRIARDLHDSVKQQVFGLAMQISTASALVEKNPATAKNYLHESENLIKEIQAELVDMIHKFSLPMKEAESFKQKIENLVSDWTRQNVMKTEILIDENLTISPDSARTLYRIMQETLSNIARHSEATEVKIRLKNINKNLKMTISDNGCGFDTDKIKKGFGLQSIRERAESLPNGWLKIESKIKVGTTVEVGCEI
jgi:signal transduction histidine kinase